MTDDVIVFAGSDLARWTLAHGGGLRAVVNGVEFSDNPESTWHLMSVSDPRLADRRLDVRVFATPCAGGDTNLYLNHWGGINLASISADGRILPDGVAEHVSATVDADGRLVANLSWDSRSQTIFIGSSTPDGQPIYIGGGRPQWVVHKIQVTSRPLDPPAPDRLVLVDVGAAGGVDPVWAPLLPQLHCVLFEPNPEQASALSSRSYQYPSSQVVQAALSDRDEVRQLNVARLGGCSSLLEPDFEELARYAVAPCFEVVSTVAVSCRRYDSLPAAPPPDMVKIDVQGLEYEVLVGFGQYLDTVLGVELESHFYPIYKGQKLISDLVSLLAGHGLRLRTLRPQSNFDRDYVEVNAYFTREGALDEDRDRKRKLIHQVLNLPFHGGGQHLADLFKQEIANR